MAEIWGIAVAGVAAAGASAFGASEQAGAASTAAGDQEAAAIAQLGLDASTFNVQGGLSLPTRELGGLAQSREAFLLGLTPDLDISADYSVPTVNFNPNSLTTTAGWSGPAASDPTLSGAAAGTTGTGNGYTASPTLAPYGATPAPSIASYFGAPTTTGGGTGLVPGSQAGLAASVLGSAGGTASTQPVGTAQATGFNPVTGVSNAPAATGTTATAASGIPNPNAVLGSSAYGSFASPYNPSTFYEDPGYQFILGQGEQQIQNQQSTTGMALSPAALSAALNYSSGLASQEFNNAYNRSMNTQVTQLNELNALSSGGQIATSGLSTAAGTTAQTGSSALAGYGNAAAAGAIGTGNAYTSGLNGVTNAGLYGLNAYSNSPNGVNAYNNPNNLNGVGGQMTTYYDANGNPYQATVASGGFIPD